MKPIMKTTKENCIACGGLAHGTPGVYKSANGEKWRCGFCNGTGLVDVGVNWAPEIPEDEVLAGRREKDGGFFTSIFKFIGTVLLVMFFSGIVLAVGYFLVTSIFPQVIK